MADEEKIKVIEEKYEVDLSINYTTTKNLVEKVKNYGDYIKPDSIEEANKLYETISFKQKLTNFFKKFLKVTVMSVLLKVALIITVLFNLTAILLALILDIDDLVLIMLPTNITAVSIIVVFGLILIILKLIVRNTEGVSWKIIQEENFTKLIIKTKKVIYKILKIFGLMGEGKDASGALLVTYITESYREEMLDDLAATRNKIMPLIHTIKLHHHLNNWETVIIFFNGSDDTLRKVLKKFLRLHPEVFVRISILNYTEEEKKAYVEKIITDWELQSKNIFHECDYIIHDGVNRVHLLEYLLLYIKDYVRHYYGINYSQVNEPFHEIVDYDEKLIVPSKVFMLDTKAIKKQPLIEYEKDGFKYTIERHLIYTIPKKTVVLETEVGMLQNNLDSQQFADNQKLGIYDYKKSQRHLNGEDYIHISIDQTVDREVKGLRELDTGNLFPANFEIIPAFVWKIEKIQRQILKLRAKILKNLAEVKRIELSYLFDKENEETIANYRKKTVERLDKINELENKIGLYQRKNRVRINWTISTVGAESGKLYSSKNIFNGKYDKKKPYSFNAVAPVTAVFNRYNTNYLKSIVNYILDNLKVNFLSCMNWNDYNLNMDRHHVIVLGYPILNKYYNVQTDELYVEPKYTRVKVEMIKKEKDSKNK